jgi:hypothetical protein
MKYYCFFKIEAYEDEDQKSIIGRSRDEVLEKFWDEDTDRKSFVPTENYQVLQGTHNRNGLKSCYTIELIQASFNRLTDLIEDTYENPQFNEDVLKTIPIEPRQIKTYETIIFIQGDEAHKYLEMIERDLEEEVIDELSNYWSEGNEIQDEAPHGSGDHVYETEKRVMAYDHPRVNPTKYCILQLTYNNNLDHVALTACWFTPTYEDIEDED